MKSLNSRPALAVLLLSGVGAITVGLSTDMLIRSTHPGGLVVMMCGLVSLAFAVPFGFVQWKSVLGKAGIIIPAFFFALMLASYAYFVWLASDVGIVTEQDVLP